MDKQKETTVPRGEKEESSLKQQTYGEDVLKRPEYTGHYGLTYEIMEMADAESEAVWDDRMEHPEIWENLTIREQFQRSEEIGKRVREEFRTGKRKLE